MTKGNIINSFKRNNLSIRYLDSDTFKNKILNHTLIRELNLLNRETIKIDRYTEEKIIFIEERK